MKKRIVFKGEVYKNLNFYLKTSDERVSMFCSDKNRFVFRKLLDFFEDGDVVKFVVERVEK